MMTYGADGNFDAAYTYGLERIEVEDLDETRPESQDPLYYLYDGLGSVTYMVKPDGNIRDHYNFDEYGKPAPGNSKQSPDGAINLNNTFGYTGEMWDEESNLLYLRARYYEPETGRFLSRDTYEGELENPLSRHLYAYVENNPVNHKDPSGHMPTFFLNSLSESYNLGYIAKKDASWDCITGNIFNLKTGMHEIAQVNVAKLLYDRTKRHAELNKSIKTGEYYLRKFNWFPKYVYADVVLGSEVWEVKPLGGESANPQLNKYKKYGKLTPSTRLVGKTIDNIPVFEGFGVNLKMKITFPKAGETRYQMYSVMTKGQIEFITVSTAVAILLKNLAEMGIRKAPALI